MLAPVVLVHLVCVSAVLCICAGGTLSFYLSVAVFFVFGPVILGHPVCFCWLCMRAEGVTFVWACWDTLPINMYGKRRQF